MSAFNNAWNLLKLSPNEFNIDSDDREGPVPKKDILQEALDMARRRPPQKPLEIENLPPQTVQTKLPEELTAGATVGDRDFRDVKFPSLK